jgi:hypothetical protein
MFSAINNLKINKMNKDNWRLEKLKYTRCTALNIHNVSTRLFYKFAHTIRDKHLAPCQLLKINGDKILVHMAYDEKATMEDKVGNFFYLNEC